MIYNIGNLIDIYLHETINHCHQVSRLAMCICVWMKIQMGECVFQKYKVLLLFIVMDLVLHMTVGKIMHGIQLSQTYHKFRAIYSSYSSCSECTCS